MGMVALVDTLAHRLRELAAVSASQWLLRGCGALASIAAILVALPSGPLSGVIAVLAVLVVPATVLIQLLRPESALGMAAPGMTVLALIAQPGPSPLQAAGTGVLLLIAHQAWALAAAAPAHGTISLSAWGMAGRWALLVLASGILSAALVVMLTGIDLGRWAVVPGILAVPLLVLVLLPREP